jgi:hypothetical protein
MLITVEVNHCVQCRHIDHSGSFTPGGAKHICGHPDISEFILKMKPETRYDDPNSFSFRPKKGSRERKLLESQCYHWSNRIVEEFIEKKEIPFFCPLKNGSKY